LYAGIGMFIKTCDIIRRNLEKAKETMKKKATNPKPKKEDTEIAIITIDDAQIYETMLRRKTT
jgi:hypothetical protein